MKVLHPCINCEYCINGGRCYIDDEISPILEHMKNCDGLILASPSYNYNVTAQMKVLLDRSLSLNDFTGPVWQSRVKSGTKAIVAGVCKGNVRESMGYTTQAMHKVLDELEIEVLDVIEHYGTKHTIVGEYLVQRNLIKERIEAIEAI